HLEPFAFAANTTQSDAAHLDVVIITLGNLYHIFSNPSFDQTIHNGVIKSLEKHWCSADQDIFILVLVFNPYIQCSCFHPNSPFWLIGGLWPIFKKCFIQFFNGNPNPACRNSFSDYIAGVGIWSYESMCLEDLIQSTSHKTVCDNHCCSIIEQTEGNM
ncbi:hypothetical protein BDQ17DRAFT_1251299, partial [Cyathus striatus]